MKIKSVHIENFRIFEDQTICFNSYSCFVGPNGVGKSTVLAALNVFFGEQQSSNFDTEKLSDEDYFCKDTTKPVRVTVTFSDVTPEAQKALSAYVRNGELVVTVEAEYEIISGYGKVRFYGQRLGMEQFREFFDAEKRNAKAPELQSIYDKLRGTYTDLPVARSKEDKKDALNHYETSNPSLCTLIPSEDAFYGVNGTGKLAPFVQWIYVPAVKDAGEEGQETKNSALGKLMDRAVRAKTNLFSELDSLKAETQQKYKELLDNNQSGLTAISDALKKRLGEWAHPDVKLGMKWTYSDPNKAVVFQQPVAGIETGEGNFIGSLGRMGHGLQRSYLLALLQELAGSDSPNAPTLILGCEEPELYQHPPQAKHMADVLTDLAQGNNQIIVTSHSPLFVNGDGFENIRLVCRSNSSRGAVVKSLTYPELCERIRNATGDDPHRRNQGLIAKINQSLQPSMCEMFFSRLPVFVEGLEDVAYITAEMHMSGLWADFRRLGGHLVPVNGKDKLIHPVAICRELDVPCFVIFDSDGNVTKADQRLKHEADNKALIALLGCGSAPFPTSHVWGTNHVIWSSNLSDVVKADFAANYSRITDKVRVHYAQEGGIEKNSMFIAEWLYEARNEYLLSSSLIQLCTTILNYAANI